MLDVIGVGFSRTGTYSLKTAFEQLGFGPCYHGFELVRSQDQVEAWGRTLEGETDWSEFFEGYRSTTDFPSVVFWRELIEANPTAKVVLTVRDPERWYASMQVIARQIEKGREAVRDGVLRAEEFDQAPTVRLFERMFGTFDLSDRQRLIERFEQHTAEVRATVPADRLLVFEVKQGWQPLCEFLGVAVPETEFPRTNDPQDFERLLEEFQQPKI